MPADARQIRLTPESKWFEVIHGGGLKPGDEVILAPGVCADGRRLEMNHRGTEGKPIVIHDTKHPGIIVYGTDGKGPNVIERNVIWNTGDNGIQAAADAVIRNNVVFNSGGAGIYSRNHQSAVVGNLLITHNTVVNEGRVALRIIAPAGNKFSGPVLVGDNALYGATAIQAPRHAALSFGSNVGSGRLVGVDLEAAEWQGGGNAAADFVKGKLSFFPAPGSYLIGKGRKRDRPADFNGTKRTGSRDAGAYRSDPKGNPGWLIGPGFKK